MDIGQSIHRSVELVPVPEDATSVTDRRRHDPLFHHRVEERRAYTDVVSGLPPRETARTEFKTGRHGSMTFWWHAADRHP